MKNIFKEIHKIFNIFKEIHKIHRHIKKFLIDKIKKKSVKI